jgi:glycosyltransferase involved in cell wall biosynthesis
MRILMLTPYFSPAVGGVENYVKSIAGGLMARGDEVLIATTTPDAVEAGWQTVSLSPGHRIANSPLSSRWRGEIRSIIDTWKPDVINGHLPVLGLADIGATVRGPTPFVLTYHNDVVKTPLVGRLAVGMYRATLGQHTLSASRRVIVTSLRYATQSPPLQPYSARLRVVPPGVDFARFHPAIDGTGIRKAIGGGPIVLFVGGLSRFQHHKGVDVLLEAVADLRRTDYPDIKAVVVGGGDGRGALEDAAARLWPDEPVAHFVGRVSDDDLASFYAAADVLVLPSQTDAEGYGMVLLEAAACGTRVVGARVGGVGEAMSLIAGGILADPDSTSIGAGIRTALQGPGCQLDSSECSWTNRADQTRAVFDEVASGAGLMETSP